MTSTKSKKKKTTKEDKLTQASKEIGKALARSSFQAEKTGKRIKQKVKDTVSHLGTSSPFNEKGDLGLIAGIGFLAGEIFKYLEKKGETATEKLIKAMMAKKNSRAIVLCAIGWLAREDKIDFSPDGGEIWLK